MLFNSIFQNVNVTLLCITNMPQSCMLHLLKVKFSFWGGGGGGEGGGLGPLFLIFLDPPLQKHIPQYSSDVNCAYTFSPSAVL